MLGFQEMVTGLEHVERLREQGLFRTRKARLDIGEYNPLFNFIRGDHKEDGV